MNALEATFYPTYLRSTGVGWCLGVGRIGGIIGPVLGGQLMSRQWSTDQIFVAAALPALISAVAVFALRWTIASRVVTGAASEAVAH